MCMQREAYLDAIMRHNMVNINNPPYASNEPEWLSISPTIMTRINHSSTSLEYFTKFPTMIKIICVKHSVRF